MYVIDNIRVHHLYITFLGGVGAVPARTKRLANLGESTQPNLNLRAYSFRLVIGGYRRVRQITTHRHHPSLASIIRLQIVHTPAKQSTATASARPQAAAARLLSVFARTHTPYLRTTSWSFIALPLTLSACRVLLFHFARAALLLTLGLVAIPPTLLSCPSVALSSQHLLVGRLHYYRSRASTHLHSFRSPTLYTTNNLDILVRPIPSSSHDSRIVAQIARRLITNLAII